MLRLQRERMSQGLVPSLEGYYREFGLGPERLRRAARDAIVLHPGPINRGIEIDPVVADGPQSRVLQQVANGVAVRMAVLSELLRSEEHTSELQSLMRISYAVFCLKKKKVHR